MALWKYDLPFAELFSLPAHISTLLQTSVGVADAITSTFHELLHHDRIRTIRDLSSREDPRAFTGHQCTVKDLSCCNLSHNGPFIHIRTMREGISINCAHIEHGMIIRRDHIGSRETSKDRT